MRWINTIFAAFSTYSALPMPRTEWNETNTRYAICCFPLVGLVCGGALILLRLLCVRLGASGVLFAALAAALPLLITGGIHMDGFMDTADALASHRDRARKLEIMKDSHCGAFAVIWCCVLLLVSFGVYSQLYDWKISPVYAGVFVLSRSLSALFAVTLPNARMEGMLFFFTKNVYRRRAVFWLSGMLTVTAAAFVLLCPVGGGCSLLAGGIVCLWYCRMTKKQFGGITGDTAGFFLQPAPFCPDRVYVSPLRHCAETAELLFPHAQNIPVEGFREFPFGDFEGKTFKELEKDARYRAWVDGGCTAACPGTGEDRDAFTRRVCRALEELMRQETQWPLVIVAHGGTQMAVGSRLIHPPQDYFSCRTAPGSALILDASRWENEKILLLESP